MYSILIKIDGIEKRKRSAALLHITAGFFLIAKAANYYQLSNYQNSLPLIPVYLAAGASLFYGFFRKRFDITAEYNTAVRILQLLTFIVLGVLLLKNGSPIDYYSCFIWAGLCTLLLFTERKAFEDTAILIDEKGLIIPGDFSSHKVEWNKLSDVIVRHDFITIFHKDRKYLQFQVMQSLSDLEIAQITGFCKENINTKETNNVNINSN